LIPRRSENSLVETSLTQEKRRRYPLREGARARETYGVRGDESQDVARAVMFFADPKASFVTGQTLFVCGGTSVGSIVY
jgi:NAD(P)-dependent dehydrogenase (short-subunit alcohol dehydrogenase family)